MWVAAHRGNDVYRIDPKTDKVIAKIDLGQNSCTQLMPADNLMWLGFCDGSTTELGVSPLTNQVVASIPSAHVFGVAAGFLWASSVDGSTLERRDLTTYQVKSSIPVAGANGVIGGGYLWDVDERPDGTYYDVITKVDVRTGQVVATLHTPDLNSYVFSVYADGILWVTGVVGRVPPPSGHRDGYDDQGGAPRCSHRADGFL